ncbi:hypothetical protein [Pseudomonas rubra]|uniref:Uncharacterized protein n=1 Tax=Pseudomonas rubra TaxID=2942627 RepID=A0ABT5PG00_9PSED|nr:hypothetical protein [Pseudomonas rubra]MDD1017057.1 hypothetical protein [Pseudomonas rubra]MDD1037116.1 hypothetical protein [Pseudomonas rubra]MDD1153777.1 hypothetical protein [Pseudomonas rubra]
MTKEKLAAQLNGLEYPIRIPGALIVAAQSSGLVILCGASDDLMEFYGVRREEIGCYNGGTAFVDTDGVLPDHDAVRVPAIEERGIREAYVRPAQAAGAGAQ